VPASERRPGPLRVLLACDWFVKYTSGLARGMAENGCEAMLLTRDRVNELPERVEGGRDAVRRYVASVLDGRAQHRALPGRVRDASALPVLARLRRDVVRFAPDVVHVQESVLDDPRLLLAAGIRPRRYAVTFHDPVPHPGDPVPRLRRRLSERALLGQAGLVFVHSSIDRDELGRVFRVRAPVEVVPHGTGTLAATPVPAAPVLLFFGRLVHYKGLEVLLDALPAVWREVPDARLVVAGAGELPAHPLLADRRVQLRHEHIPEADVPGLFTAARCVVLPYTQASQSGVGSQAKVFGRPMVVTDAGGLPELVADGSGLVVTAGDPSALASALIAVLREPALAERLGERAALGGMAADWPAVAAATLAAYRRHGLAR
jgi:glycosyltransferase involved in cell wall biosynthesis